MHFFLRFPLLATFAGVAACSSATTNHSAATTTDAGTSAASPAAGTARDTGMVTSYDSKGKTPIAGATVVEGDLQTTTDSTGHFTLDVPIGEPLSLYVTAAKYTKTWMPEMIALGENDRDPITIPTLSTFELGQSALQNCDPTLGILYVVVRALPSCADISGGTITVSSPSGAQVVYFDGLLPSSSLTAYKNQVPVGAVYNIPIGAKLDLTIRHPTCKQVPFPVTVDNVTYTGNVTIEGGSQADSVGIYYLQ